MSSGRTGTRLSSRPVASRSAERIAAVETTVGGSPTPLAPMGADSSGSSTSSETTGDRLRVHCLANVLGCPDPDDAREAELDVDLDDDLHRRAGEGDVGRPGRDLPGLRIERRGLAVAVHALLIDLVSGCERSAAALELVADGETRGANGAGGHPGLAGSR